MVYLREGKKEQIEEKIWNSKKRESITSCQINENFHANQPNTRFSHDRAATHWGHSHDSKKAHVVKSSFFFPPTAPNTLTEALDPFSSAMHISRTLFLLTTFNALRIL